MKSFLLRATLLTFTVAATFAASAVENFSPPQTPAEPLALVGARVFPSPDAAPIPDAVVILTGGKIAALGPRNSTPIPPGASTIDCTGLFLTAGFQNSHVHFTEAKWAGAADLPAAQLTANLESMLTRYGFTTVVDTGSQLENTAALRRRIENGEIPGPRILTAGSPLYPKDGIPFYLKDTLPPEILRQLAQPANPVEAAAVVRERIAGGADVTKLFTGSWIARGKVLPMQEDVATRAAAEAHGAHKLVFAHASNVPGLEIALRAKVDILAHAIDDARGLTPEHLRRMKAQNMALVPTLKLFGSGWYLFEIQDMVRDFARGGGQILFGTDVGYLTDYDPAPEYASLGAAGLSWREILASLTTNPAARFGESSRRGRIAPGMDADIVVLASDPVLDVRAFADVRLTLRSGKMIYSTTRPAP